MKRQEFCFTCQSFPLFSRGSFFFVFVGRLSLLNQVTLSRSLCVLDMNKLNSPSEKHAFLCKFLYKTFFICICGFFKFLCESKVTFFFEHFGVQKPKVCKLKKKNNNNSAVAIFSFPPEVKLHGWSRREFCSLKTKGPVFCKGVRDTSGTLFPTGGECSRLTVWRS